MPMLNDTSHEDTTEILSSVAALAYRDFWTPAREENEENDEAHRENPGG